MTHTIKVIDGRLVFLHDQALHAALSPLGPTVVRRASYVEPYRGGWIADMEPSGGSWLFVEGEATQPTDFQTLTPFATRDQALAAERAWLQIDRRMGGY